MFRENFLQPQKYSRILRIGIPLILSQSGMVIMQFIDGMFLSWHSAEDIAAVATTGCASWLLGSVILGTVAFTSTFTANFIGAQKQEKVGSVIWQGLYIALAGGLITLALSPFCLPFFRACGHNESLAAKEATYLQICLAGSFIHFAQCALAGFHSGRGDNTRLMVAQVLGQLFNILGDYVLIFGKFGFPQMGIAGAALATVGSFLIPLVILFADFLKPSHRATYHTSTGWHLNMPILKSLLSFGLPCGFQNFVDAAIWTFFCILVGRIGTVELAATSICFRLNSLGLLPVMGIGKAMGTLIGQAHGRKDHKETLEYSWHGSVLCYAWMAFIALTYLLFPTQYFTIFQSKGEENAEAVTQMGMILIHFVALYSMADSLNVSFCSTLMAVGDSKYAFKVMFIATLALAAAFIISDHCHGGIRTLWILATTYVMILPPFWLFRILQGKWKDIVIAK